jgi:hypothetical protein
MEESYRGGEIIVHYISNRGLVSKISGEFSGSKVLFVFGVGV